MSALRWSRFDPLSLVALAAATTLPLALLHSLGRDEVQFPGELHLFGVGVGAGVAAAAAVALTIAGAHRLDARTVQLGTAFSVMAALLAVHGLTTPGFLVGPNGVVAFSGAATLAVGGALLALAAVPVLRRPADVPRLVVIQGVLLAAVVALGALGVFVPSLVPSVPEVGSTAAEVTLAVGLAFYALVFLRAIRVYRLTRRRADLSVVAGVVWLGAALPAALLLGYWQLGWWLGHGFELVGLALVGIPVALDLRRPAQSRPLTGGVAAAQLVSEEEAFLGGRVRALTRLLAERDGSTEEHTRRVALLAVELGEELGLAPERLRVLAAGGLLHDIGKLSVPDAILRKPGALTDEEFAEIRKHPEAGERLLVELGGFPPAVRRVVLGHHERLDGSGYPHGLRDADLGAETRILGVCDVYDALISPRVYRDAWPPERALQLLREGAGTLFDPKIVAALERVLTREELPAPATLAIAV